MKNIFNSMSQNNNQSPNIVKINSFTNRILVPRSQRYPNGSLDITLSFECIRNLLNSYVDISVIYFQTAIAFTNISNRFENIENRSHFTIQNVGEHEAISDYIRAFLEEEYDTYINRQTMQYEHVCNIFTKLSDILIFCIQRFEYNSESNQTIKNSTT